MKKNVFYITVLTVLLSCKSQHITVDTLHGSFDGTEKMSKHLSWNVMLELNPDSTCSLRKSFDLALWSCMGEWAVIGGKLIEIKCNRNPILSDIEKALISGGFIEGNLELKVLNKNKLMLDNIVLKRKK